MSRPRSKPTFTVQGLLPITFIINKNIYSHKYSLAHKQAQKKCQPKRGWTHSFCLSAAQPLGLFILSCTFAFSEHLIRSSETRSGLLSLTSGAPGPGLPADAHFQSMASSAVAAAGGME